MIFVIILSSKTSFRIRLLNNVTPTGILLALVCVILFYLLLDQCLDPFFEGLFPVSDEAYTESLVSLAASPVVSFIRICLLAPVIEEILMKGFVLGGLQNTTGTIVALLVSAVLFAILHFNMVQTLSAFICGVVLGALYLKTGSLLCCILAHSGYNMLSYFVMIGPMKHKLRLYFI